MTFIVIYLAIAFLLSLAIFVESDTKTLGNACEAAMLGIAWPITICVMIFLAITIFGIDD